MPSSAPPLHLRLAGETRGPYTEPQLRALFDGGAISPDTECSASPAGPWVPLKSLPVAASLFPPPPEFRFKSAGFAVENRPSAPPVDVHALIAAANRAPAAPIAAASAPAAPPPAPAPLNEVERMVREVRRRTAAAEPPLTLAPFRERHRRALRQLRHFFLLAALGDAIIATLALHYGRLGDGISLQIWIGWAGLFTIGTGLAVLYAGPDP